MNKDTENQGIQTSMNDTDREKYEGALGSSAAEGTSGSEGSSGRRKRRRSEVAPLHMDFELNSHASCVSEPQNPGSVCESSFSYSKNASSDEVVPCERIDRFCAVSPETQVSAIKEIYNQSSSRNFNEEACSGSSATSASCELGSVQLALLHLLRNVQSKCDQYGFFSDPVDTENDYSSGHSDLVDHERAMDFGTIEALIRNERICDINQFERYLMRVVECALKRNNDEENFVRKQAKKIKGLATPLIVKARQRIAQVRQNHGSGTPEGNDGSEQSSPVEHMCTSNSFTFAIPKCEKGLHGSTMKPCRLQKSWLDAVPEMVTVCNEAARRSALRLDPNAALYDKPLSEKYMRGRLACHLPLRGYIVRVDQGEGNKDISQHCMQGFVVTTDFITWSKSFRFDVLPHSGITPCDRRTRACDDGTLTYALQKLERKHDEENGCYVFPRLGEICLLGGLGCGAALLERSLKDFEESGSYDFVALQSTKMAIPFYEKHGFVRVGAVARFFDIETMPECAYRHWSESSGRYAIEASYMMARRINFAVSSVGREDCRVKMTGGAVASDVSECRQNAIALINDALPIKTDAAGGSFTYLDLIDTAQRLAASAGDEGFVKLIDRSLAIYRSNASGRSKAVLREGLNFPNHRRGNVRTSSKRVAARMHDTTLSSQVKVVSIVVDGDAITAGENIYLEACLPVSHLRGRSKTTKKAGMTNTNLRSVSVKVVIDGYCRKRTGFALIDPGSKYFSEKPSDAKLTANTGDHVKKSSQDEGKKKNSRGV